MTQQSILKMESAVVGAIITDTELAHYVQEMLSPDDFSVSKHSKICRCVFDLINGEAGDIKTVDVNIVSHLTKIPVADLEAFCLGAATDKDVLSSYLLVLNQESMGRKVAATSENIRSVSASDEDIDTKITKISAAVSDLFAIGGKSIITMGDCISEATADIVNMAEREDSNTILGLPTGFAELDEITCGYQPGQLIIIAGRPAMGKTSFVLANVDSAVEHLVIRMSSDRVMFVSLEMPGKQIARRYISMKTGIPMARLKVGALTADEWNMVADVTDKLQNSAIRLNNDFTMRIDQIRNAARKLKRSGGLAMLVLDYLQLVEILNAGGRMTREQMVSAISRELKNMALELGIPVIALSQLSRDLEKRADKRPVMSDLRESGAIEQDADVIIMLYRDEVYNPATKDKGKAELIVVKNRDGAIGTAMADFDAPTTRFMRDNIRDDTDKLLAAAQSQTRKPR